MTVCSRQHFETRCWTTEETAEETYHKKNIAFKSFGLRLWHERVRRSFTPSKDFQKKKGGREGSTDSFTSLSLSVFSMFSKSFVFQCQVAGRLSSELGLFYPSTPSIFSADTRSCTYTHIDMHAHTWLIRRHPHNSIRLATRTKATIKDSYLELMTHGCVWLWSVCVCTVCLSVCGCVCACVCVRACVRACMCVCDPAQIECTPIRSASGSIGLRLCLSWQAGPVVLSIDPTSV